MSGTDLPGDLHADLRYRHLEDDLPQVSRRIQGIANECHCANCSAGHRAEAVALLDEINTTSPDIAHVYADWLLLAIIGDANVTAAFVQVDKWYA